MSLPRRDDVGRCGRQEAGLCCRAVRDRRSGRAYRAWLADELAQEKLKQNIANVLVDMFDTHFEVPYIAQYRKEVGICHLTCMHACCMGFSLMLVILAEEFSPPRSSRL